ncbi:helix-turn-helix domain-containing protein [Micromonospora aurantiaca (nom. illeg.)]|uniref:helix-turn-helix domain-containing protein n=1 Tax=Micromonospora aurantiaca (nom. illeg.) TaxID=47850 RepID=UPI003DA22306
MATASSPPKRPPPCASCCAATTDHPRALRKPTRHPPAKSPPHPSLRGAHRARQPAPPRRRPPPPPTPAHTTGHHDEQEPRLYTPAEAAALLRIPESWLRRHAGRRQIPCTFLGKHLRFSAADLAALIATSAEPATGRRTHRRRHPPAPN